MYERHIAGEVGGGEQYCRRCCRPLVDINGEGLTTETRPWFPGEVVAVFGRSGISVSRETSSLEELVPVRECTDCEPINLCPTCGGAPIFPHCPNCRRPYLDHPWFTAETHEKAKAMQRL